MKLLKKIPIDSALKRELVVLLRLLFVGLVPLPILIYYVGRQTFGPYTDAGFLAFLGNLYGDFFSGAPLAVLIGLGPYALWQLTRGTWHLLRAGKADREMPG